MPRRLRNSASSPSRSTISDLSHGLTRLQSRFQADPSDLDRAQGSIGKAIDAEEAEELGLVTFALDDIRSEPRPDPAAIALPGRSIRSRPRARLDRQGDRCRGG